MATNYINFKFYIQTHCLRLNVNTAVKVAADQQSQSLEAEHENLI